MTPAGAHRAGLSSVDLARMVEATEAAAYADLLRAAPAAWGCAAERTDAAWVLFAPTLDVVLFNRVLGFGLDGSATPAELLPHVARYRAAGLRNFAVPLSPAAAPPAVRDWLGGAGLVARDEWTKVYRPARAVPPAATDLRIGAVRPEQADAFAAVTTTGFGMPRLLRPWLAATVARPGWHHYLAWDGSEPVAAGALFVHGDVGWLGIASTLPAARRRGAQGALMAQRLTDGTALGCRWFVTETGKDLPERPNPSFHNMVRAGFAVAYDRPNFMPPRA